MVFLFNFFKNLTPQHEVINNLWASLSIPNLGNKKF